MGSIHNTRSFPAVLSSKDYLDNISNEQQRRYVEKLQVLGSCDPYLAPAAVFEPLNTSASCPNCPSYLVENPFPFRAAKMKAYKSGTILHRCLK